MFYILYQKNKSFESKKCSQIPIQFFTKQKKYTTFFTIYSFVFTLVTIYLITWLWHVFGELQLYNYHILYKASLQLLLFANVKLHIVYSYWKLYGHILLTMILTLHTMGNRFLHVQDIARLLRGKCFGGQFKAFVQ